jgi:hypothetical protein
MPPDGSAINRHNRELDREGSGEGMEQRNCGSGRSGPYSRNRPPSTGATHGLLDRFSTLPYRLGRWTAAPQPERGWEPARQVWAPGIHRGARCGVVFVEGKAPVRRPRDQPRLDLLGLDDFPPGSRVPETVRERLRQRYSAWTTDVHPRFDRPRSLNPAFPPGLALGGGRVSSARCEPAGLPVTGVLVPMRTVSGVTTG